MNAFDHMVLDLMTEALQTKKGTREFPLAALGPLDLEKLQLRMHDFADIGCMPYFSTLVRESTGHFVMTWDWFPPKKEEKQ